ncbi:MAG: acyltransferase [bacterium]
MSNALGKKESYRADIDGLRAVAVMSALLFHARFSPFQGGLAGVDVFFVISGFLITGIILGEIRGGAYSIARFYARRARRILPALYATILLTVAGTLILNPEASREVGKSIIAVALFSSNFLFWRESGYFGPQAQHMPLLHTWSLAVEEQYYLLFPLFLLVVHRYLGDRFGRWIAIAAVISFVTGLVATRADPSAAFYLAPTRAWELLLGAVVATDELPRVTNGAARDALAALGLALVIAATLLFTPDTAFPGVAAAVPTVGSALIIYTGTGTPTRTGRLLGMGPLTFIGTISYSSRVARTSRWSPSPRDGPSIHKAGISQRAAIPSCSVTRQPMARGFRAMGRCSSAASPERFAACWRWAGGSCSWMRRRKSVTMYPQPSRSPRALVVTQASSSLPAERRTRPEPSKCGQFLPGSPDCRAFVWSALQTGCVTGHSAESFKVGSHCTAMTITSRHSAHFTRHRSSTPYFSSD